MTVTLDFNSENIRYSYLARRVNFFANCINRVHSAVVESERSKQEAIDFRDAARKLCQLGLDCVDALNGDESVTEHEVHALLSNFSDFTRVLDSIASLETTSFELKKDLTSYQEKAAQRVDMIKHRTELRRLRDSEVERQFQRSFEDTLRQLDSIPM